MSTNNSKPIFAGIKTTLNLDAMSILNSPKFLNNNESTTTLLDQHAFITDLFESVETKSHLEPISDRILNLTIASTSFSSNLSNQECCLKYLHLCAPYCSPGQFDRLFKTFCSLLNETIISNETKRVNFLVSFLDILIGKRDGCGGRKLNFDSNREQCEEIVHKSVELLRSDEERALSKLGIALLERFANIDLFRSQVLDKCLNVVANSSAVAVSLAIHSNQTASRVWVDRKKRLESHVGVLELSLTTALADEIFRIGGHESSYLTKIEFWTLVQYGLVHTNPLSRRQALYLLKRANDFACSSVNLDELSLKLKNQTFGQEHTSVYMYRGDWRVWNDFFLCIELLEETSVSLF